MNDFDMGPDLTDPRLGDRSVLMHCLDLHSQGTTYGKAGWAIEFGVGTGASLEMIAQYIPVIGFDSFEGLPEDWRPDFRKGHFAQQSRSCPTDIPGATIVPGLFSDTLPDYDWPTDIALIHFDADLYSSTVEALEAIGPHIKPGCILVFDEFHGYDDDLSGKVPGEQRAFFEYEEWDGLRYEVIGHGREQWAVRVR